jgi:hypothetical protein
LKVGEPQEFEEENTPDCGERNDRTLQKLTFDHSAGVL